MTFSIYVVSRLKMAILGVAVRGSLVVVICSWHCFLAFRCGYMYLNIAVFYPRRPMLCSTPLHAGFQTWRKLLPGARFSLKFRWVCILDFWPPAVPGGSGGPDGHFLVFSCGRLTERCYCNLWVGLFLPFRCGRLFTCRKKKRPANFMNFSIHVVSLAQNGDLRRHVARVRCRCDLLLALFSSISLRTSSEIWPF